MRPDLKLHLAAGAVLGLVGALVGGGWVGVTLAVVVGGGKELVWDKWLAKGTPAWDDFAYTAIAGGAVAGIVEGLRSLT